MNIPPRYVAVLAASLVIVAFLVGSDCHGRNDLDAHLKSDDSTRAADRAIVNSARSHAAALEVQILHLTAQLDTAHRITAKVNGDVDRLSFALKTARESITPTQEAALPENVRRALEDADSLRVSITPMRESYERELTILRAENVDLKLSGDAKDSANAALMRIDTVSQSEIALLKENRAPRCGMKCGGILGSVLTIGVAEVVAHLDGLLSLLHR